MSRCELTGKSPVVVNLVSHSNIKTKSRSLPNVQQKRIFSATLNQLVNLKMATGTIRALEHCGGFDKFILGQPDEVLSRRALAVKKRIQAKTRRSAKAPAAPKAAAAKSAPKKASAKTKA